MFTRFTQKPFLIVFTLFLGYHSVRVFAKRPLVCRPNQPNQCPGDAQCLENKSAVGESRWLCCEQDAGELCGPTEKALKVGFCLVCGF